MPDPHILDVREPTTNSQEPAKVSRRSGPLFALQLARSNRRVPFRSGGL